MLTSKEMSLEGFEKKMAANGWIKKIVKTRGSWRYFYYNYAKPGKVIISHLFHCDAPDVFWFKINEN